MRKNVTMAQTNPNDFSIKVTLKIYLIMMQVINRVILYCRQGFEKECAAEITDKAADLTVYGTARILEQRGYVVFECSKPSDANYLIKTIPFRSLIFARQFFAAGNKLTGLPAADRITPILTLLGNKSCYGEVRVESTDTPEGKALAVFCRKFTVPLRKILRENKRLARVENQSKPVLHLFFESTDSCYVGYSYGNNNSPFYMGIPRLKLPADAPSRSTLKLEEAFYLFIPNEEWQERLAPGMLAVDLGASPGGWTYQLVKRSMMVYAIDNGPMDKSLMMTGAGETLSGKRF